ncbi:surfactant protein Bb [Salminus brasiliensis]|uniref:surfactant protein Bb n=1 Tax=Salminus brasiliensis TaxID=930266 RepID=UPI003B82C85E
MFVVTAAFCLLAFASLLPAGKTKTIGPYSPPLKTSSLSMTKNMCADCTEIIELFLDMLSKQNAQELIQESLNELCRRLPEVSVVNDCMQKVETYLPVVIKGFLSFTTHKEGDICMVLGLCATQPENKAPEILHVSMEADGLIQAQPSTGTGHKVQISPQCTFCLFIIKKLEDMLPKERTEESVVKALEKICDHLPDHYKEQCNNFLETYGKQILDFLLTSATPHTICTLLHLCLIQERSAMVPYIPSECQSCRTLVILTQIRIGQNATKLQTSSALWKTCHLHPNALPGCELFVQKHGVSLMRIMGKQEEAINACQKFFCMGQE